MALNPCLGSDNEPLRVKNENFILKRKNVEFEIIIDSLGKLKGVGDCILSTLRIILINKDQKGLLKAFDLPLALMYSENMIQQVFGPSYIEGFVQPLESSQLPGEIKFKVWFNAGGISSFCKAWRLLLE